MTPHSRRWALAALALFWAASVRADLRTGNFPIHHALWPEHANSSLLSAVIEEAAGVESFPRLLTSAALRIAVQRPVLDRGWDLPEGAELQVRHLLWPDGLFDLRPGAKAFVIVRSGVPQPGDHYVSTVLPRGGDGLPGVSTEEEAIRLLERDLLAQIPGARSDRQLVALLQTLGPILTRGSRRQVEPLLSHRDQEVRRAALGALFRVAPTGPNARRVVDDLQEFFAGGPGRACVSSPALHCEPLGELFRSYPCLDPDSRRWGSRWSEREGAECERLSKLVLARSRLSMTALRFLTVHPPQIDHVVIAAADLDRAIEWFAGLTGVRPVYGGKHPGGTHNALVSLGERLYLEILAVQPGAEPPDYFPDQARLDQPRPIAWLVSAGGEPSLRKALEAAGFKLTPPEAGSRTTSGGDTLRWKGFGLSRQIEEAPFFIVWAPETPHPWTTSPNGCTFGGLAVSGPHADDLKRLRDALGLPIDVGSSAAPALTLTLFCPLGRVVLESRSFPP